MQVVSTEKAPAAIGPYSQGYIEGTLFFSSGQVPLDPVSGTIKEESITGQATQACENVGALLEAAGTSFDRVVKTTCYLSDMADFAAFNDVYATYFTGKPARSCVAVRELPKGAKCEIEVIAEV